MHQQRCVSENDVLPCPYVACHVYSLTVPTCSPVTVCNAVLIFTSWGAFLRYPFARRASLRALYPQPLGAHRPDPLVTALAPLPPCLHLLPTSVVLTSAFAPRPLAPAQPHLAAADYDGVVALWDANTNTEVGAPVHLLPIFFPSSFSFLNLGLLLCGSVLHDTLSRPTSLSVCNPYKQS